MRRTARPWPMEITVEGINLARFVRLAGEQGTALTGMRRKGPRKLAALVREGDIPALQELALRGGWQLHIGRRYGAGRAMDWLRRRWLLAVLLVLLAAVLLLVSRVMWQVEVVGAGPYEAEIQTALDELGIVPPMLRSQVDIGAIRDELEWRYPRIAWFECGWRGSTLVIRPVTGVLPKDSVAAGFCDVVAERDAIVQQVITRSGTAVVSPGDFVHKGDILIRGEERTANGEMKPVAASGSITGRVWEGAAVQMSCREIQTVYTGNEQTVRTIRTPWFDLWRLPACEYDCYDINVSMQELGGMFLPVKLYAETRMEAVQTAVMRDLAQVQAEAEQAARRKLHEKISEDESLIDIWENCSMIDSENVLSLAVGELLTEIGMPRFLSDMAASD